jgi:hypothetical protein
MCGASYNKVQLTGHIYVPRAINHVTKLFKGTYGLPRCPEGFFPEGQSNFAYTRSAHLWLLVFQVGQVVTFLYGIGQGGQERAVGRHPGPRQDSSLLCPGPVPLPSPGRHEPRGRGGGRGRPGGALHVGAGGGEAPTALCPVLRGGPSRRPGLVALVAC